MLIAIITRVRSGKMEVLASTKPGLWRSLDTLPELDIVYDKDKPYLYEGHLQYVLQDPVKVVIEDGQVAIDAPKMIYFGIGNFKYYGNEVFSNSLQIYFDLVFKEIKQLAAHFGIEPLLESLKRKDLLQMNIPLKKDPNTDARKNIGVAYVYIDDPLIVALILGYNINGSKRVEIIEDPNWNAPAAVACRNICRERLVGLIASLEQQLNVPVVKKEVDFANISWGDYHDEEDEETIKSRKNKLECDLKSAQEQLLKLEISTIEQIAEPLIALPEIFDRNQNPSNIKPVIGNMLLKFYPDEPSEFTLFCRLRCFDAKKPLKFTLQCIYDKFKCYSNHDEYPKVCFVSSGAHNVIAITYAPDKHDAILAFEMNRIFQAPWNPTVTLMLNRVTDTHIDDMIFKHSQGYRDRDYNVIDSLHEYIEVRKYTETPKAISSRGRYDTRGGPSKWRDSHSQDDSSTTKRYELNPQTQPTVVKREVDDDGFEIIPAKAKSRGRGRGK